MGQKVLILGESGTGKTTSLRNFKPEEVCVISCCGKPAVYWNAEINKYKPLPIVSPSYKTLTDDILEAMKATTKKVIVIDDAQYIMSFQYMRRIKENGWDKWNDIQGDFFNIIQEVDELPEDTVVYFLSHIQRDEEGFEKIKTMGKMLDEKITIEGLFTTVLKTSVQDGKYFFLTQNSGKDTVKSPIGMFDSYAIDNDLKYVDTKIRNYYEIGDFEPDEVVKELDQEVAKPEVEKPDADGRRRRRTSRSEEIINAIEPKLDDSGSKEPEETAESGANTENSDSDKTKNGSYRRRQRKDRNGEKEEEKPAEAPAEEKTESTEAEGKRRRRRRKPDDIVDPSSVDDFMDIPDDVADTEVPF